MLGINGQPFISYDDEIDISIMKDLHNEMCLGLAMVNGEHESCKCIEDHNESPDLYDYRYKDIGDIEILPEDMDLYYVVMNREQKRKFLMFKYGVYFPWTYLVRFLSPLNWFTKHLAAGKSIPKVIQGWFPKTIEYIYALPMFSEIGRIDVFGVHPNNIVQCHRDRSPEQYDRDDEFVMISPNLAKPLYIYDPILKQKHYMTNHLVSFNALDYHGADPICEFSYTIRVDGIFKPEYKERMHYGRQNI